MRLTFTTLAFAVLAMPAQAQIWDGGGSPSARHAPRTDNVARSLSDIDDDIRDGRRTGQLSGREARSFRRESDTTRHLSERYRTGGGLTPSAEAEMSIRTEALQGIVDAQRLNGASQVSPPSPR